VRREPDHFSQVTLTEMTMTHLRMILVVGLLFLTGCAASSSPQIDSGCPPGSTRVNNEDTGEYDCASQREYEDIVDRMDERM
jgi:uncharacterized lipoprotein YajG